MQKVVRNNRLISILAVVVLTILLLVSVKLKMASASCGTACGYVYENQQSSDLTVMLSCDGYYEFVIADPEHQVSAYSGKYVRLGGVDAEIVGDDKILIYDFITIAEISDCSQCDPNVKFRGVLTGGGITPFLSWFVLRIDEIGIDPSNNLTVGDTAKAQYSPWDPGIGNPEIDWSVIYGDRVEICGRYREINEKGEHAVSLNYSDCYLKKIGSSITWYVKTDGSDNNNGTSWNQAFKTIHKAIWQAANGDEIWVGEGTYPLTSYIWVDKAVGIYGGFKGTETQRNQRDSKTNVTTVDGQGSVLGFDVSANATIDGFTITNCSGDYGGGMMIVTDSSPTITNCIFTGNSATNAGGGIYIENASSTITNCIFSGNSSNYYDGGGGIYNYQSSPVLTNCTFYANRAWYGGAIYNSNSSPTITNCILWGDTTTYGQEIDNSNSLPTVNYSDIQGGYSGTGNINADPIFVDPANSDLHLQAGSHCINAGDDISGLPEKDLDGNNRVFGAQVDMGAYEYQGTDIKVNGSDEPVTVSQSDTINVTVTLDNLGQTDNADWWLAVGTPSGIYFFTFEGWTENWQPGHQGPLFYLDSFEVLKDMPVSGLSAGTYTLYFGVDTVMDGDVTWDSVYYDTVVVNVTE